MAGRLRQGERRADALSKASIVEAAIAILDNGGEAALTFRALAARLSTGSGALYWHVADKEDLLAAATGHVVARVTSGTHEGAGALAAIRATALGMFDAIDEHPWVGAQLSSAPWRIAMPRLFEDVGRQLQVLGVPAGRQFDAASAIVNYVLGVSGQNAANARAVPRGTDRAAFLAAIAERWMESDPADYPFVRQVASQLRDHDDREQFLAGIDLILAGIGTLL